MHGLRDLQRGFAAFLVTGDAAPLADQVTDARVSAVQCLNIHRNNVTITLREALAAVYPVVQQLVGSEFFADAARNHVREYPCRSGNLHDFGREFPETLAGDGRLQHLAYLPDVAALEWAFHEVFHGPHSDGLDFAKLQDRDATQFSELRFSLHPGLRLLKSQHPVLTIWEAHQSGEMPDTLDLGIGGERVLLVRPRLQVELHRLSVAEFAFLNSLSSNATLEEATETACACDDAFDLESRLTALVAGHVIVDAHG